MSSQTCGTCVFIPGKNWKLSLAELVSFLEARRARFEVQSFSREFIILNIYEGMEVRDVADFGGIIKIGNVSKNFSTGLLTEAFLRESKENKTRIKEEIATNSLIDGMLEKASGK